MPGIADAVMRFIIDIFGLTTVRPRAADFTISTASHASASEVELYAGVITAKLGIVAFRKIAAELEALAGVGAVVAVDAFEALALVLVLAAIKIGHALLSDDGGRLFLLACRIQEGNDYYCKQARKNHPSPAMKQSENSHLPHNYALTTMDFKNGGVSCPSKPRLLWPGSSAQVEPNRGTA